MIAVLVCLESLVLCCVSLCSPSLDRAIEGYKFGQFLLLVTFSAVSGTC